MKIGCTRDMKNGDGERMGTGWKNGEKMEKGKVSRKMFRWMEREMERY